MYLIDVFDTADLLIQQISASRLIQQISAGRSQHADLSSRLIQQISAGRLIHQGKK
jgi:hypothetical protein